MWVETEMSMEDSKTSGRATGSSQVQNTGRRRQYGPNLDASPDVAGRTLLIIGRYSPELRQFSIWMDQFAGLGVTVSKTDTALEWLCEKRAEQPIVIFDADDIGDADDVVDFGYRLRAACPEVPVIMVSTQVRRNDFSSERMMICDATLRSPTTLTAFRMGLDAALQNNRVYMNAVTAVQH